MPTRFNTPAKQAIRSRWAKPLLSFLSSRLNKKLFYLGLPSDDALDIKDWVEYLRVVYAFQCREYPKPSDSSQNRKVILALDDLLREFERKKQLETYEVFDGYLEEVVLRGFDNSPTQKRLIQPDVVTVYNLDYCNSLTNPITFVDTVGNTHTAYKLTAIKRLMDLQCDLRAIPSKKFLLFLTIHCSYYEENKNDFETQLPTEISDYVTDVQSMRSRKKKAPYLLKAFAFNNLCQFFTTNSFMPEFLPVIHYVGNSGQPLLFFTVIGTQIADRAGVQRPLQKPQDFLNGKFISVSKQGDFINNTQLTVHDEKDWKNTDSIELFQETSSFANYWKI